MSKNRESTKPSFARLFCLQVKKETFFFPLPLAILLPHNHLRGQCGEGV